MSLDLTDLNNWPDGAEACAGIQFLKWVNGAEYYYEEYNNEWSIADDSWGLDKYKYEIRDSLTMRPQEYDKWKEGEERMNVVQQNDNDGEHYEELEANKNNYQREIKSGVFVDVYDVLKAFNVVNPAMAHAIKKMLAPGQRGAKDTIQDMKEAIQSIERAIELEK